MGSEETLLEEIIRLVREMDVKEEEFGPKGPIHNKILEEIKKEVEPRYREKLTEYNIDYVKRETRDPKYGRIELAVEVDRRPGHW